jgi:PEGA domain-containing protein
MSATLRVLFTLGLIAGGSRGLAAQQPPPPSPPQQESVAHLSISSTPSGVLMVDDSTFGRTPVARVKLSPGTHSIVVTRSGYRPYRTTIDIRAGERLVLKDIVLQRE